MTFTTYSNSGPFVNSASPGLGATLFNNIENFLDQIQSSVVADSNVTSDGSGNWAAPVAKAVLKSKGGLHTLTDWNFGAASVTTSTVVTHGIKNASGVATAPTVVMLTGDTASTGISVSGGSVTTTQFTIFVSSACTVWWLALLA